MPKSDIPGYEEALAKEADRRRSAFIGGTYEICGIEIVNITPFLLARLRIARTPFIEGGKYSLGAALQFLWILSPSYEDDAVKMEEHLERYINRLGKCDGFTRIYEEIDEFVAVTFEDGAAKGHESVPYVIGEQWICYRFRKSFSWPEEKTMHTPYRVLFGYLRCERLDNEGILYNESDKLKDEWLIMQREAWLANRASGGSN